jgi:hypothetical protein
MSKYTHISRPPSVAILVTGLGAALTAQPAFAHGFGQRYDLPVPLWLWISGAALAVSLSFVVMGLFIQGTPGLHGYPRANVLRWRLGPLLAHPAVTASVKTVGVILLALVVVTGIAWSQNSTRNPAPTLVWVLWWVGFAYVSALIGNLWALVNPWSTLFAWVEALFDEPDREFGLRLRYPKRLGVWPAVALFLAFAWVELVFAGRALPANLALFTVVYSLVTWTGMALFGRSVWLAHGDPFALAFGVLARFSPTEVRVTDAAVCRTCPLECRDRQSECVDCYACFARARLAARELNVRPFAVGLLRSAPLSASMTAFVVLLLSTVTYDGFTATPAWADTESALYAALAALGPARLAAIGTLGLLTFPAVFLAMYLGFAHGMASAGGRPAATAAIARAFVLSLVPIAIGYHLAHYFTYLLIQGQLIIPLASDPLARGWDLLGTAGHRPDIGVVGARFAWYTAVIAIVLGHIVAVFVAHVTALREFENRALALRSQYPMLALMVGYTMVSLWIVAQPIVETGAPS